MGKIGSPTANYVDGEFGIGEDVSDDIKRIVTEFNGNISTVNFSDGAVDDTKLANGAVSANNISYGAIVDADVSYASAAPGGLLVWQCGPDYTGTEGHRIIRVKKNVTWDGTSEDEVTLYFSQSENGFPDFSEPPAILGTPIVEASNANDAVNGARVTNMTTGFCTMNIAYGGGTGDVTIHASFAGPVNWR